MDAVEQAHWTEVLGACAWLTVLLEIDFLFWLFVLRLIGVL